MNEDYPNHRRMLPFSHIRAEELHWHHLDLLFAVDKVLVGDGHSDKLTRKMADVKNDYKFP